MLKLLIKIRDWFVPPIHGRAGYVRGRYQAQKAAEDSTEEEVSNMLVEGDRLDPDDYDRGWCDECKLILRKRFGWTDHDFGVWL